MAVARSVSPVRNSVAERLSVCVTESLELFAAPQKEKLLHAGFITHSAVRRSSQKAQQRIEELALFRLRSGLRCVGFSTGGSRRGFACSLSFRL